MKSLMLLWKVVLNELSTICGTDTTRDYKTATSRFEHEGLSFFTITLPDFCSDLQKGLDRGWVDHDLWTGFRFSGGLPRFLGGFLDLVFDRNSGVLLNQPSIDAIFALRQLTLMFGKIALECSEERTRAAIEGYVECEKEVRRYDQSRSSDDLDDFTAISRLLFANVFSDVDFRVYTIDTLVPRHGPGATADKLKGNRKFEQRVYTQRLEAILPAGEFILPNWRYFPSLSSMVFLEPGQELPVRVITVPKTLKTPRIIAIEPTVMQYTQQALLDALLEELGKDDLLSSFLGFDDQVPNQNLARIGSFSQSLATLDLSEASDRVSNQLVRAMLSNHPHFAEAVDASRSRKADVPDHGVIRLAKFASMGSALCFPMEAMVFLTIIFLGIQDELKTPLTRRLLKKFVGSVRVYGDDIIIPVRFVSAVVRRLEAFGFRVNYGKSFWTGKFRESCGKDYYDGHDVSIVRCRRPLPANQLHVEEVISTVSLRNQFYQLGLWKTCQWLDELLENVLRHYPVVEPTSSVLGRHSFLGYEPGKMCKRTHRPLVKGWVVRARSPISRLDGEGALLKYFLKRGSEPLDKEHLERAGRPDAVAIMLRWSPPY